MADQYTHEDVNDYLLATYHRLSARPDSGLLPVDSKETAQAMFLGFAIGMVLELVNGGMTVHDMQRELVATRTRK